MSLFRRFLGSDPDLSIGYLCQLMQEQNALTRELIRVVSGRPSVVPVARVKASESRIRTDKDVFQVDRAKVIQEEFRKKEAEIAPWRVQGQPTIENGPASVPVNPGQNSQPAPTPSPDLF